MWVRNKSQRQHASEDMNRDDVRMNINPIFFFLKRDTAYEMFLLAARQHEPEEQKRVIHGFVTASMKLTIAYDEISDPRSLAIGYKSEGALECKKGLSK